MNGIRTFLKKSRISKILVSAIIPLVLLLSFLGSSRKVYAYDPVEILEAPYVVLIPDYHIEQSGEFGRFSVRVYGEYSTLNWETRNNIDSTWNTSNFSGMEYYVNSSALVTTGYLQLRVRVGYYNELNELVYVYSNTVNAYNPTFANNNQVFVFTEFANVLLHRFIEWFNIFLGFMIDNPIVFVFLALAIIIASIGTLRHVIGGSNEKKDFSY